jgi:nicotinate-nucleotide pyrophosphorylase (carboxylating)
VNVEEVVIRFAERSEDALVEAALAEDIGNADWTTTWTVPEEARGEAVILARAPGVIAGTRPAGKAFGKLDPDVRISWRHSDGDRVQVDGKVCELSGRLGAILTAERTALNFLGHLSGVATLASRFVEAVQGTGCTIVDTRKTTPGWRSLEKEAVVAGGAMNHRAGLYDMVLLKENHLRAAGGVGPALDLVLPLARARELEVELEVTGLAELKETLARPPKARPDRVLLDNMPAAELREAVRAAQKGDPPLPLLEASGGITLESVRRIAETGVDLISVGSLTHSASALDLSLLIDGA